MQNEMHSKLNIRVIQEKDIENVIEFMENNFFQHEPLVSSEPILKEYSENKLMKKFIKEGLSLMAEEFIENGTEQQSKILGVTIAAENNHQQIQQMKDLIKDKNENEILSRIMTFLIKLEEGANVFERFNIDKALHSHMTAVDCNARGRGIGVQLRKALMALGREKGYQLMTVDCTSFYSARQCENLGMQCVNVIEYKKYVDCCGKPIFNVKPPHECAKSFVMHL